LSNTSPTKDLWWTRALWLST